MPLSFQVSSIVANNAEFEHRHGLLRSLGQHSVVFVLQLFFDPLGKVSNFSLCLNRKGLQLKDFPCLSSLIFNRGSRCRISARVIVFSGVSKGRELPSL
jgi:hypothetical protein